MKYLILFLILPLAHADLKPKPGAHSVIAFLYLHPGVAPRIIVNPMSRSHYVLEVQNPDSVSRKLRKTTYFGYVKVGFELFHPIDNHASVVVKDIAESKEPALYDRNFQRVK